MEECFTENENVKRGAHAREQVHRVHGVGGEAAGGLNVNECVASWGLRMYQDGMSGGMHSDGEIWKGKSDGAVGLVERGVGSSGSDGDHVSVVIDDCGPGEATDVIGTYTPS